MSQDQLCRKLLENLNQNENLYASTPDEDIIAVVTKNVSEETIPDIDNETEPDAPKPLTHVELMKCMMPLIDHMTVTKNSAILKQTK